MNTPSHFLMTAALRKRMAPDLDVSRSAVLLGSVAPDIPLYLLTVGGLFYFGPNQGRPITRAAQHIFGTLYFEDRIWLSLHNFLHSPLSLALLIGTVYLSRELLGPYALWLQWFLIACVFHSFVDVLTHHDDGPLLLWPFDWTLRFRSPVSYWDHRHYGSQASRFELLLDLALITYLVRPWQLFTSIGRRRTG